MTGLYPYNIDAKGRLFIPAKLREKLGATFHVTIGQDRCLSVYSDESWNAFMDKLKEMSYSQVKNCVLCLPMPPTVSRMGRVVFCCLPSCASMRPWKRK